MSMVNSLPLNSANQSSQSQCQDAAFALFIIFSSTQTLLLDCFMTAAEMLLYGVYVVLFGFYMNILYKGGLRKNRFLHLATISLFILSSVHSALLLAITALDIQYTMIYMVELLTPARVYDDNSVNSLSRLDTRLTQAAFGIYVGSNVIADGIFIYRCYAIWGFRRRIIVIPAFFTLVVAAFGCAHLIDLDGFFEVHATILTPGVSLLAIPLLISLGTTILLMMLSAGRIWWLARKASNIMGSKTAGWYYTVCAMILESGAVYGAGALAVSILSIYFFENSAVMSGAVTAQLVGIAPTIIAIRVGMKKSVESVDSFVIMKMDQPRRPQAQPKGSSTRTTHSIDQPVIYIRPESDDVSGEMQSA